MKAASLLLLAILLLPVSCTEPSILFPDTPRRVTIIEPISEERPVVIQNPFGTETIINGQHHLKIQSKPIQWQEDGKWKPMAELRSWKGTGYECVVTKSNKSDPDVECLDYNATDIKVRAKADRKMTIPVRKVQKFENGDELELSRTAVSLDENWKELTIEREDEIHFGEKSTVVDVVYSAEKSCKGGTSVTRYVGGDATGGDVKTAIGYVLDIPPGSVISAANVTFTADSTSSDSGVFADVYADDADNSIASTGVCAISYTPTTAFVDWDNLASWTAGVNYTSPDFASVMQEVIDREGWASGNQYTAIFDGTGSTSSSERQYADGAAWLNVLFNAPPSVPDNLTIDGGSLNVTISGTVDLQCDGSVDTDGDTITYIIEAGNQTSNASFSDFEIRVENDNSAAFSGSTWTFANAMSTSDFATIITGKTDTDDVYGNEWGSAATTGVVIALGDDSGSGEIANYQAMVIANGEYSFPGAGFSGEDIEIKCGVETGSFSSGTVTFDTAFPDATYVVFCESGNDADVVTCTVDDGSETATDFDFRLEDDADNAETVSAMSWCAFTDAASGGFTIDGVNFLTGEFTTGGTVAMDGTDMPSTDYAIFTQNTDGTGTNPCYCEADPSTTDDFTVDCQDDASASCTTREFDYIAVEEILDDLQIQTGTEVINYTVLGNHTDGNSYSWDTSSYVNETFDKMRCKAVDLDGTGGYSDYFTVDTNTTIEAGTPDVADPVASAWLPTNESVETSSSVNFTISCADETAVDSIAVWLNSTGTWQANVTNSTGVVNNTNWTVQIDNFINGDYTWAAWCDDGTNTDFSANYTLTINATTCSCSAGAECTIDCETCDGETITGVNLGGNDIIGTGTGTVMFTNTLTDYDQIKAELACKIAIAR